MKLGYVPAATTEYGIMNPAVKMGPIGGPETPVKNCRCTLSNVPEDSFERIEEFKYLRTSLTNQNAIQEEIKSTENLAEW